MHQPLCHVALKRSDDTMVLALWMAGVDIAEKDVHGLTIVYCACKVRSDDTGSSAEHKMGM